MRTGEITDHIIGYIEAEDGHIGRRVESDEEVVEEYRCSGLHHLAHRIARERGTADTEMAYHVHHRSHTYHDAGKRHQQRIEPIGRSLSYEVEHQYGAQQFGEEIRPRHLVHLLHALQVPGGEEHDTDIHQRRIDI